MVRVTLVFVLLLFRLSIWEQFCSGYLSVTNLSQPFQHVANQTTRIVPLPRYSNVTYLSRPFQHVVNRTTQIVPLSRNLNVTARTLANFTYTLSARAGNLTKQVYNSSLGTQESDQQVDCLGLGTTVAAGLEALFRSEPNGSNALDVRFVMSSTRARGRVHVDIGEQFGLQWTDFRIERRTVVIVHGFLSHSEEDWIRDMERAFHEWDDVNVVIVDWSAGGNTWNYYKAAVNTRIVGYQISKLIEHITNATIIDNGPDTSNWGPLHLIGHSLGAHICGFAAKELKKRQNKWTVKRITGLDPAQPCFRNADSSVHLHKEDAPFLDVIHTNGRLLTSLGLGLPEAIGHVDFYPNGGKTQPGCVKTDSYFSYLKIPKDAIQKAICSHGRSYLYFTESLASAAMLNCSFWAHHWDLTYGDFTRIINEPCDGNTCTEMGIRAEMYNQRGTFFVTTASSHPFCFNSTNVIEEVKRQMRWDYNDETED